MIIGVTFQESGQIINTASVSSNEMDPDVSNNKASETTDVLESQTAVVLDANLAVRTVVTGLRNGKRVFVLSCRSRPVSRRCWRGEISADSGKLFRRRQLFHKCRKAPALSQPGQPWPSRARVASQDSKPCDAMGWLGSLHS